MPQYQQQNRPQQERAAFIPDPHDPGHQPPEVPPPVHSAWMHAQNISIIACGLAAGRQSVNVTPQELGQIAQDAAHLYSLVVKLAWREYQGEL